MRIFIFLFGLLLCACNGSTRHTDRPSNDSSSAAISKESKSAPSDRPYPTLNEFLRSIRCNAVSESSATINDLGIKKIGRDTTIHSFTYSGIKFQFVSFLKFDSDEACDSLFSYYFLVNGKTIQEKSIPDSLRNHGFKFDEFCGLRLNLDKANKIELNGVAYLVIPSSTNECIGGFCNTETDHIFEIRDNIINYLTVDGWELCDVNNDNLLDQIVINDDPLTQYHYLDNLKKERPGDSAINLRATKCANVQIWTYKNGRWEPLADSSNRPYFILMGFEAMYKHDTYRILDQNWIKIF